MLPSSRTPEGDDIRCLICGHEVRIEPSVPPGDAPCPHCGTLLWFPNDSSPDRQPAVDSTPNRQVAADQSPDRQAAVLWQQAQSAIETENWLEAVRCLRRAIAIDPSNIVFRVTLSKVRPRVLIG